MNCEPVPAIGPFAFVVALFVAAAPVHAQEAPPADSAYVPGAYRVKTDGSRTLEAIMPTAPRRDHPRG